MDQWNVVISGEGGVGKTALVQQVRQTLWFGFRILADLSP
jgi:nucleoside-triphosphatase THEP1